MPADKGYVYIMTNPCFRENCIKIGKTSSNPEKEVAKKRNLGNKNSRLLSVVGFLFH